MQFGLDGAVDHARADLDDQAAQDGRIDFSDHLHIAARGLAQGFDKGCGLGVAERRCCRDFGGAEAAAFGEDGVEAGNHGRQGEQPAVDSHEAEELAGDR